VRFFVVAREPYAHDCMDTPSRIMESFYPPHTLNIPAARLGTDSTMLVTGPTSLAPVSSSLDDIIVTID